MHALKLTMLQIIRYAGLLGLDPGEYQSGFLSGYGPVYQVFKVQGIDLRTLRDQVLNAAKSARDGSLISRQTYEESVRWFRES